MLTLEFSSCFPFYRSLLKFFFLFSYSCFVYGAVPKKKIRTGKGHLYLASKDGQLTVAYQYGHPVNIHSAVKAGDMKLIQLLYEENPGVIHEKDEYGNEPLHWAVKYDLLEIVEWLLDRKVNPEAKNLWKQTPFFSVSWSGEAKVAQRLLADGIDPTIKDKDGFTPQDFFAFRLNYNNSIARKSLGLKETGACILAFKKR